MNFRALAGSFGLLAALAGPAAAHVVLDQAEAPAGAYVRLAFRVGHGCNGAATTGIRVTVPSELGSARPMPHPGWTLSLGGGGTEADHGAHAGHGAGAGHGSHGAPPPREIAWTGGKLEDALYDEFVMQVRTPAEAGAVLAFPVVQECEGGVVSRWTERASAPGARVENPAPLLRLVPGR